MEKYLKKAKQTFFELIENNSYHLATITNNHKNIKCQKCTKNINSKNIILFIKENDYINTICINCWSKFKKNTIIKWAQEYLEEDINILIREEVDNN